MILLKTILKICTLPIFLNRTTSQLFDFSWTFVDNREKKPNVICIIL